jgi:hypothetical protein
MVTCALVDGSGGEVPLVFAASSAIPNPFQGATRVQLSLPDRRRVRAEVFDVAGRRVVELVDRTMDAGRWDIAWDGRRDNGTVAGAGVYLLRIQAGADVVVRRAMRVR